MIYMVIAYRIGRTNIVYTELTESILFAESWEQDRYALCTYVVGRINMVYGLSEPIQSTGLAGPIWPTGLAG
jgi:hypothetical protein